MKLYLSPVKRQCLQLYVVIRVNPVSNESYVIHNIYNYDDNEYHEILEVVKVENSLKIMKIDISGSTFKPSEFPEGFFIRDLCLIRDDHTVFNNCAITKDRVVFFN